jgi:hypothetical protein
MAYIVELLTGIRPTPRGGTDVVTHRSRMEGAESRHLVHSVTKPKGLPRLTERSAGVIRIKTDNALGK